MKKFKAKDYLGKDISDLPDEERMAIREWLDNEARMIYSPYDYNCLLGWFILGDDSIPLSPREAGFDE